MQRPRTYSLLWRLCTGLLALAWLGGSRAAAFDCPVTPDADLYPPAQHRVLDDRQWAALLEHCVPVLRHTRGSRWPMILWSGGRASDYDDEQLRMLAARGFAAHVRLHRDDIPHALRLQRLGLPVVVMDARGGNWAYEMAPAGHAWRLPLRDEATAPARWLTQPNPLDQVGWVEVASDIRRTLAAFRAAGINVDAFWLDYEGQPSLLDYEAVLASPVRDQLPASVTADFARFSAYRRRLWLQLMSSYVAAPIREFYPTASTTNWIAVLSSREAPVLSWDNWHHPDGGPWLFSASNPVAYGIDSAFWAVWPEASEPERGKVDRIYQHILLRQVSADAWNRQRSAPEMQAIPWVARVVRDEPRRTPMMSRSAYREVLRHLWLRGVAAMQVFNPGNAVGATALAEVQDAQAVYDEMLAWGDLLEHGEVMNYQVPMPDKTGVLWSGLRDDNRAVVRVVNFGGPQLSLKLQVWPDQYVLLEISEPGTTYIITRGSADAPIHAERMADAA